MIPFSAQSEENVPIILVHGSFAELSYINLIKEEYEFRCTYLYNEESFLRGNKAKIIIHSMIYSNKSVKYQMNIYLGWLNACNSKYNYQNICY